MKAYLVYEKTLGEMVEECKKANLFVARETALSYLKNEVKLYCENDDVHLMKTETNKIILVSHGWENEDSIFENETFEIGIIEIEV